MSQFGTNFTTALAAGLAGLAFTHKAAAADLPVDIGKYLGKTVPATELPTANPANVTYAPLTPGKEYNTLFIAATTDGTAFDATELPAGYFHFYKPGGRERNTDQRYIHAALSTAGDAIEFKNRPDIKASAGNTDPRVGYVEVKVTPAATIPAGTSPIALEYNPGNKSGYTFSLALGPDGSPFTLPNLLPQYAPFFLTTRPVSGSKEFDLGVNSLPSPLPRANVTVVASDKVNGPYDNILGTLQADGLNDTIRIDPSDHKTQFIRGEVK